MLARVSKENSGRTAVVDADTAVSYEALVMRIDCFSTQLQDQGVRKGHRVAVLFPNGVDFIAAFFSIASLGAVAVPLNHHWQQNEICYAINTCDVSVVMTSHRFASLWEHSPLLRATGCKLLLVDDQTTPFETRLTSVDDLGVDIDPNSPVLYQFSSGSTGSPKRIGRTHVNLLCEIESLLRTLKVTSHDRFLGLPPFSHVNGLMRSMMLSLAAGATLYTLEKFEPRGLAEFIEKNAISVFVGVPFMFSMMAKGRGPRRFDLSSLRLCVSASAPMPAKLNQEFFSNFGLHVRQLYGSTETGTISVNLSADLETSLESVGTPIDGVEIDVLMENGRSAEVGELGEVAVKSPAAIQAYEGLNDTNQSCFRDGFFLTGDLGWREATGLLYLGGRKKFLINKAGYKINPREIEDLLESYAKVEEAVVIGLPTPYGDEKVKAVIVLKETCTEEEIIEYCRAKIASFKIPSLIEFTDALPKSAIGKVQRAALT
jgi:long-chain acyl-CoA synthetase